ncbi:hypothetical protein ACFLYR_07230 [Chloroflexota bacterium]
MKEDAIGVSISFEILLTRLFGKRSYHGFSEIHDINSWKKHIIKLIGAIRKSILVNVDTTDSLHISTLLRSCNEAKDEINKATVKNQINTSAIEHLAEIVFELMGRMPDHRDYKVINRPEHWKLDSYRKLNYTQTSNQKVSLILDLVLTERYPFCQTVNYKELWNKLCDDFADNGDEFLRWFRQTYPHIYLEVF